MRKPWEELILPARRAWMGLAAAWVFVLAINIMTGGEPSVGAAAPGPANPDSIIALQRQERLMAQLAQKEDETAQPAKTPEQRPRSEAPVEFKVV